MTNRRNQLVQGLFNSPEKQLEQVERWNQRHGWEIPKVCFEKASLTIPEWPDRPLTALVLAPYFPDWNSWNLTIRFCERQTRNDLRIGWAAHYEHLPGAAGVYKNFPLYGLRWEVIDLSSNKGEAPEYVRSPTKSPHLGLLAAAALHPEWIRAMNGRDTPFVWIPGLIFRKESLREKNQEMVPFLAYSEKKGVILDAAIGDDRIDWACPEFLEKPQLIPNPIHPCWQGGPQRTLPPLLAR